jgi:hypothetical protein
MEAATMQHIERLASRWGARLSQLRGARRLTSVTFGRKGSAPEHGTRRPLNDGPRRSRFGRIA